MAAVSKTLLSILDVAVEVAAVAVGTALGGPIGAIIGSLVAAGIDAGLNAAFAPSAPKPEQTETALKTPTPPRVSGYGTNRLYTVYGLFVTANDGTAIDVGAYHDGRVDSILAYYLGDVKVTLVGQYVQVGQDGQFGDHSDLIRINTTLGPATNTAFGEVIAKVPDQWTSYHRGDGVVTGCVLSAPVKAKFFQRNYPTGGPNAMPLSLAMRLQLVFDWRDSSQSVTDPSTWKWSENAILHLAHYLLVRDNKDWATHFVPTLDFWTDAANVCDEPVELTSVQTVLVNAAPKGSGHITVTNLNGLTTGTTITISATGNTSLTETRTVTGISGDVLALSSPLSNDHPARSQVTWATSTATEARYRSCVAHKHTDAHKDVVMALLACCDGWLQPRADGALVVHAGAYVVPEPADAIGPDAIVSYSLQDGVDEENAVNQITLTYISANHDYAVVDTDPWEDQEDQSARGKVLSTQIANQVPSFSQARRLAKAVLARTMAPKRGTVTTNSRGRNIRGKRYVRLTIIDANTTFLDAVVEVTKLTRNMGTFGYTFDWVLADPNAYAWDPATEQGNPAPVGNSVALQPLDPPTVVSVTPEYGQDAAFGQPGVRLTIMAQGPNRADLTWYVRTRPVGAVSWVEQEYPDEDPGASVTLQTDFVPLAQLEAEVAYQVGDGRVSPWGSLGTTTDATGSLPGMVQNLSVTANGDGSLIVADWDDTPFATSYRVEIIVEG